MSGGGRGPAFNSKEDVTLCHAFLQHSLDPIRGAHQSKDELWNNIVETYYSEGVNDNFVERTTKSIRCRWQLISKTCSEFRGAMNAHESLNRSGANDLDSVSNSYSINYLSLFLLLPLYLM